MRAAVVTVVGHVEVTTVDDPTPGSTEVVVRVRAIAAAGRVADPLQYAGERNPKHRAYAKLAALHHRKAYQGQSITLNVEDVS